MSELTFNAGSRVYSQEVCIGDAYYILNDLPNGTACYQPAGFQFDGLVGWKQTLLQTAKRASTKTVNGTYSADAGEYVTSDGKQTSKIDEAARMPWYVPRYWSLWGRIGGERSLLTETDQTEPAGQAKAQVNDTDGVLDLILNPTFWIPVSDRVAVIFQPGLGVRGTAGSLESDIDGRGITVIPARECIDSGDDANCTQRVHYTVAPLLVLDAGLEFSPETEQKVTDDTLKALAGAQADFVVTNNSFNPGDTIAVKIAKAKKLLEQAQAFQTIATGNAYLKKKEEIRNLGRLITTLASVVGAAIMPTPSQKDAAGTTTEAIRGEINASEVESLCDTIMTEMGKIVGNKTSDNTSWENGIASNDTARAAHKKEGTTWIIAAALEVEKQYPIHGPNSNRYPFEFQKPEGDDAQQLNALFTGTPINVYLNLSLSCRFRGFFGL